MHDLADSEQLFSDDELDAFILNVWKGGYKNGKLDKKRVSRYANTFMEGVEKGYGKSLASVDYDTPDHMMLSALANNVFHFSAAKNRAEIEALSAAMRGADGKPVSFAEFKRQAAQITGEFQGNWLKAEYDLAINASTMAARWVEFESDPNAILVYRTAGDARVRQSHKQLDGIARPVNDKFWNTYYPPNGWNCRCDVEKTLSGRITGDDQLPHGAIDDVPPMFRSNFAKEGLAFPPGHAYYKTPGASKKEIVKAQAATVRQWAKENLVGKSIAHPDLGEIRITNQGVKELLNQPHNNAYDKNEALYSIKDLLKNGTYLESTQDGKGRPFTWHYVEIEFKNQLLYAVVKEDGINGKTLYSLVDTLK